MPDNLNEVYASIDRVHANESASTRRQLIAGTTMVLGATGMLALAETADAQIDEDTPNTPENILTVAATAEVYDEVSPRTPDPEAVNVRMRA